MRETVVISVGLILGICTASSPAMTITGQVVDNKARPVPGAEVVVCETYRIGFFDDDARTISPVVRTDAEGRFALDVGVTSQRDAFLVARKAGLAHAWERLNGTLSTRDRKHFPLVLEPAGVLTGQVVDADGKPAPGAEVQATPASSGVLTTSSRGPSPAPGRGSRSLRMRRAGSASSSLPPMSAPACACGLRVERAGMCFICTIRISAGSRWAGGHPGGAPQGGHDSGPDRGWSGPAGGWR